VCASACALIWFGAVNRVGVVGLHRPRVDDPDFKGMPPAEAAAVYREVLGQMGQYMTDMEAPRPMIDAMVETASSEIRWVDEDHNGLSRPASFAEWADASCGPLSDAESFKATELWLQKNYYHQSLTNNDEILLKVLQEKRDTHVKCNLRLRFSSVERLQAP
jgi:hypothetical protein